MIRKLMLMGAALVGCIGLGSAPREAHAGTWTVNVIAVGGQSGNMFVVLSNTNIGNDVGCPGARLILPSSAMDAVSMNRFYAAMLAAYTTGSQVTINVSTCYGTYPSMQPTDFWFAGQPG
jgi:hypothetical protein